MWRRPLLLGRVSPSGGDVGRGFFLALPASRTPVCTISAASLNTPRAIPAVGSAARSALVAAFVPFMRKLKRGSETAVTATEPARRERRLPSEPATDMPGGWVLVQGRPWGPAQRWQIRPGRAAQEPLLGAAEPQSHAAPDLAAAVSPNRPSVFQAGKRSN